MIYLDNAATTKMSTKVMNGMLPYMNEQYANPSGIYEFSQKSADAVKEARSRVAKLIHVNEEEIYFTSGGSEADNWALKSVVRMEKRPDEVITKTNNNHKNNTMNKPKSQNKEKKHIITSKIEHHAILKTCAELEKEGVEITYLDVDEQGIIKLEQLEKAIKKETICISVMTANNEVGTIQPIHEIGKIARRHNVFFHTDAVQAFGHIPIFVKDWNIHMLSASAHKLHGPKGVGCLYIRKGIELPSYIYGGGQEAGKRAGTENVPGIVGFGIAAEEAAKNMRKRSEKELKLRNYLIKRVLWEIPYVRLNGACSPRLSNNANFSFQFIDGEALLVLLDSDGICASAASACSTGSTEPSHVLVAMGVPEELAYGALRITISSDTTKQEIDYTVEKIKEYVKKLREMSSEYKSINKK